MNPFRQLLASAGARAPVGTWLMSASPIVAEAVGHAGFEWAVLDMEHAPLDMMDLVHMLQAVSATRLLPVVRVPWNDTVDIKRALDAGATTLLVPFVQNAHEAAQAVAATRYPPQGRRGMAGMSRASGFGTAPDYFASANQNMAVIVQLETVGAIDRLDEIAGVDGVDALFIGPSDLSGTMGYPGQTMHPDVLALTQRTVQQAKALGKPIGTIGATAEAAAQYRAMGFDFVAISSDLGLLMHSSRIALALLAGAAQAESGG